MTKLIAIFAENIFLKPISIISMDKIQAGKYVELVYEIFVVNGDEQTSVFKFNKEHPDAFVFGMDLSLIEGFHNHIINLEQGEKFDFTLKSARAPSCR